MTDLKDTDLIEIVYISEPGTALFDDDVIGIIQQSESNNAERGITGVLLYDGEHFLQVLEGKAEVLWDTYADILADPRHSNVHTVHEGRIARRMFDRWGMAYRRIDTDSDILEVARRQLVEGRAVSPDLVNVGAWIRDSLQPPDTYRWSREAA